MVRQAHHVRVRKQSMVYIIIGEIIKEHGLAGEVSVWLYNPDSQILKAGLSVEVAGPKTVETIIKKTRPGPKGLLVQFEHLSNPEQAKEWRGAKVAVDKKHIPLQPQEHLVEELKGFALETTTGETLGEIAGFFAQGAAQWLVVKMSSGEEELLPLNDEWIKQIDETNQKIIVDLPEGLFEKN